MASTRVPITVEQAVLFLRSVHRSHRTVLPHLVDRAVGYSDGANLTLLLQVQQGTHGFFNRCSGILPMRLVEIDVIGFETLQAVFDFVPDGLSAQVAVNARTILIGEEAALGSVPNQTALGGQNHLVATPTDRFAHDALGKTEPIGGRRIDEVDAGIE